MFLRASFLVGICCLLSLVGCSTGKYGKEIDRAPKFKVHNVGRLGHELAWFYADVQDVFFGVDYYDDMEGRFGDTCPYPR